MTPERTTARLAGLLYLFSLITAVGYVPRGMEAGTPDAMLARVEESRTLFELSIFGSAIGFIDFLVFAFLLRRLLSPVSRDVANLMLLLAAVSVPISLAALAPLRDILELLDGSTLARDQLAIEVALALKSSNNLMEISLIFWGLWLFPYGWLVFRSGFLPRVLGLLIMLGGVSYLLGFFGPALVSDSGSLLTRVLNGIGAVTLGVGVIGGELGTALWLLVTGGQRRSEAPSRV